MTRHAPTLVPLMLAAVCVASVIEPASAQSVRGRVIDEAGDQPMAGAIVSLLDLGGARIRAVLTNQSGVFVLRAGAGSYRLRVEMIGRRSVEAGMFVVTEGADPPAQTIRMPVQPITLSGIDVRGAERCDVSRRTAQETYVVWAEAEKALRAASLTSQEPLYRFRVAKYFRELNPRNGDLVRQTRQEIVSLRSDPCTSLTPAEIEQRGYVKEEGGQSLIYGPNTDVLLSREFQNTHCLGLRRGRDRPDQIGLTFEPIEGRVLPDIEGVLWLGNMPRSLIPGDYTGFAEFIRLPEGTWIIRRWWLRSPPLEEAAEVLGVERVAGTP
jgi:hypothetical protein